MIIYNNIVFIGGIFPQNRIDEYKRSNTGIFQNAADSLQKSIIEGINKNGGNIFVLTSPFLDTFPNGNKSIYISESNFSSNAYKGKQIGFLNIKLIDLFSKYYSLKRELLIILNEKKRNNESLNVIIYGIFPYFMSLIPLIKKYKNTKICLIVPDLPEMMGGDSSKFSVRLFNKMNKKIYSNNLKKVDSFILISKHMAEYLNISSNKWEVVEGIFNSKDVINDVIVHKGTNIIILYSGTLALRYGIENLLRAFTLINDERYRLWICGEGEGKETIMEYIRSDKRISYLGQLDRDEVLKLQTEVSILVNPRTNEGEYTKYSFPSKTMEYLASGTPTVLYRLDGIPEEYYNYSFVCNDNSPVSLKEKLLEVGNMTVKERSDFGVNAKKFIFDQKNEVTQSKKILDILTNEINYANTK